MSSKSLVKDFLRQLHQIIKIWDIFFVDRDKNAIQDLADLNITAKMREEIILELRVEDYSEGPLPETQFNGKEMWVFGKNIKSQDVYIKLTIVENTGRAICISFHKATHSMVFPFKEES